MFQKEFKQDNLTKTLTVWILNVKLLMEKLENGEVTEVQKGAKKAGVFLVWNMKAQYQWRWIFKFIKTKMDIKFMIA